MSEPLSTREQQLDRCTDAERAAVLDYLRVRMPQHPLEREWGVGAEIILSAIARSYDLTKRGVRGLLPKLFLSETFWRI
jgi:hypothetical protein